jgi:hypothetical protein
MFEGLADRVWGAAEARGRARAAELAHRAAEALPRGISASAEGDGVRLEGRGLGRRMALEPALRLFWARLG